MASSTGFGGKGVGIGVPPLVFRGMETGGGWGLGEQFARLPPAEVQQKKPQNIFKVAATPSAQRAGTPTDLLHPDEESIDTGSASSSPQPPTSSQSGRHREQQQQQDDVPETVYKPQAEDDDNTFVDHGSTFQGGSSQNKGSSQPPVITGGTPPPRGGTSQKPTKSVVTVASASSPAGVSGPSVGSQQQQQQSSSSTFTVSTTNRAAGSIDAESSKRGSGKAPLGFSATGHTSERAASPPRQTPQPPWVPPRMVSRTVLEQNVRDMAMSPNGRQLWTAMGDDPLLMWELDGTDLVSSRSVDVTQVYCMAFVRIPAARQTTFQTMPSKKGAKSPKSTARRYNDNGNGQNAAPAMDTYALWCGVNRGGITIIDLGLGEDVVGIPQAHKQTIDKIWYLDNGKVWTAGRDKAVKVWDPQTRRTIKSRNIAAILSGICYVRTTRQVWAIADDNIIRLYEGSGDNARMLKSSSIVTNSTIRMKSEVHLIDYCVDANLVWIGLKHSTVLMYPDEYEVARVLPLTITSIAFHKKTAIITGHGAMLHPDRAGGGDPPLDSIALLDITNPTLPTVLFVGGDVDGVRPAGIRLFMPSPLAVVALDEARNKRKSLLLFTYEETAPFGKAANLSKDKRQTPQQKSSVVHRSSTSPPNAVGSPIAMSNRLQLVSKPIVEDTTAVRPVGLGNLGERPSTGPSTALVDAGGYRAAAPPPAAPRPEQTVVYRTPPPVSNVASELMPMILKLTEKAETTNNYLALQKQMEGPLKDFAKLHFAVTQWLLETAQEVPALSAEEKDALDRQQLSTAEGKAAAIAVARLRKHSQQLTQALHHHQQQQQVLQILPPPRQSVPPLPLAGLHPPNASLHDPAGAVAASAEPALTSSDPLGGGQLVKSPAQPAPSEASSNAGARGPEEVSFLSQNSGAAAGALNSVLLAGGGGGGDATSEALMQWISELSRSGQAERQAHQQQIQSLQRHNRRIMERNAALVTAVTRVGQTLRTYVQRLIDDAEASQTESPNSDIPLSSRHRHRQLRAALDQSLHQVQDPSLSSTPKDINECANALVTLLSRAMAAQQAMAVTTVGDSMKRLSATAEDESGSAAHSTTAMLDEHYDATCVTPFFESTSDAPGRSASGASGLPGATATPRDTSSTHRATATPTASNRRGAGATTSASVSPPPPPSATQTEPSPPAVAISVPTSTSPGGEAVVPTAVTLPPSMPPRHLLSVIRYEVSELENSLQQQKAMWSRVEDVRLVIYSPYEHGEEPDLRQDFMQNLLVWDVLAAQVMLDVCRDETNIFVMEALLDRKDEAFLDQTRGVSTAPVGDYGQIRGSLLGLASEENRERILAEADDLSSKLISPSCDAEMTAKHIRDGLQAYLMHAPGYIRDNPHVNGLLALSRPVRDVHRVQGVLYWSHLTIHLLTVCLEAAEELLYTADDCPTFIETENFNLISQKLNDWRSFVQDTQSEAQYLRSVFTTAMHELDAQSRQGMLQSPGGSPARDTTVAAGAGGGGGGNRSSHYGLGGSLMESRLDWSVEGMSRTITYNGGANGVSALAVHRDPNTDSGGGDVGKEGNGGSAPGDEQQYRRALMLNMYMILMVRTNSVPSLLLEDETGDGRATASSGADLASCLEELIESAESLATKTMYLDKYCQSLQNRIAQVVQDNASSVEATVMVRPCRVNTAAMENRLLSLCTEENY